MQEQTLFSPTLYAVSIKNYVWGEEEENKQGQIYDSERKLDQVGSLQ